MNGKFAPQKKNRYRNKREIFLPGLEPKEAQLSSQEKGSNQETGSNSKSGSHPTNLREMATKYQNILQQSANQRMVGNLYTLKPNLLISVSKFYLRI